MAAEKIEPGADRIVPGSFDDLISRYYRSPDFLDPGARTQEVYRGVIERWRVKYGKAKVRDLESAARRFAEAGCSNQQIKSWTGHTTDSEVSRYTAAADQQALSDAAGEMLMANLAKGLAIEDDNSLEKGA